MTEAFSIPRHSDFLGGYLDAVARTLTTDTELVGLSVTFADAVACDGDRMTDKHQRVPVENWSREFCAFVEGFLGIDARSRLGFLSGGLSVLVPGLQRWRNLPPI